MKYSKNTRLAAKTAGNQLIQDFEINDSGGFALVRMFADSFSDEIAIMEKIKTDGMVTVDRFGIDKPHILLPALKTARSQKLAAIKALNLDLDVNPGPGRPGPGFTGVLT